MTRSVLSSGLFVALVLAACSSGSERARFTASNDAGAEGGTAPPSLGGEAGSLEIPITFKGTVWAPNGSLPLSNALVYIATEEPAPIPEGAYCDKCVKLPDGTFTVSAADGTFDLVMNLPKGNVYLVVQKGQFRRVRKIEIEKEGDLELDDDDTTLPGKSNPAKGDTIPNMVVLKDDTDFDPVDQSLEKLGITQFTVKQDRTMLEDATELSKHHIVFIPCGSANDDEMTSPTAKANLQSFVESGGKLYVTDWSYEFVRQPFPGYLNWAEATEEVGSAATGDEWDAPATAQDQGLADWLAATGDSTFSVEGNWTTVTSLNTMKGKDPDGALTDITPKAWVTGLKDALNVPTTVSFEAQCGRVLFSSYHTENSNFGGTTSLTAQEKALLYVLLEVGVCVGESSGVH